MIRKQTPEQARQAIINWLSGGNLSDGEPYTPNEVQSRLNALLVIEAKRLLRDRTPANVKRAIELLDTVRETYA